MKRTALFLVLLFLAYLLIDAALTGNAPWDEVVSALGES